MPTIVQVTTNLQNSAIPVEFERKLTFFIAQTLDKRLEVSENRNNIRGNPIIC